MIVLSNSTAQTIQPGASALFDLVPLRTGRSVRHREGSGNVSLCCGGIYEVTFGGNVSGDVGTQPNLAIAIDGEAVPESIMVATIGVAGDVYNVGTTLPIRRCECDSGRISVINTGTTPVILAARPTLYIRRIA